jgi:hypothetical protein
MCHLHKLLIIKVLSVFYFIILCTDMNGTYGFGNILALLTSKFFISNADTLFYNWSFILSMKKFKSDTFFKHLVLVFSIIFLLGLFANMLYIPRYAPLYAVAAQTHNVDFNRSVKLENFHTINFFQIIDRPAIDSDQHEALQFTPKCVSLIFAGFGLADVKSTPISPQSNIYYNLRRSYLSFCTFRI